MKKQIMSIAAAIMMTAAIPLSSMSGVLAVNSVMAAENTNETTALKTGDILTFSKSDWNITQPILITLLSLKISNGISLITARTAIFFKCFFLFLVK